MEKRAILAAVLMAGLLVLYQALFFPSVQETRPPAEKPAEQAPAPAPPPPQAQAPTAATLPPIPAPSGQLTRPEQRTAVVETPFYHAVVSSEGGKLQEWTLKYRGDKPMVVIGEFGPAGLIVGTEPRQGEVVPMMMSSDGITLGRNQSAGDLVLRGESEGFRVTETLGFSADGFTVTVRVRVENATAAPRTATVALPWVTHAPVKNGSEKFHGQHATEVVWSSGGHVERLENLSAVGDHTVDGAWSGMGSTWYLAALIPQTAGFKLTASGEPKAEAKNGEAVRVTVGVRATPTIAPGQAWEGHLAMYIGPKEADRLQAYGLEGSLNFGGFPIPRKWGGLPMEWIGLPILKFMNWVYRYVGNYGVAII